MKYPRFWSFIAVVALQACLTSAHAAPGYAVREGDTFAKIARANGVSLGALLKANQMANPNHIVPGARINIPPGKTSPKTVAAPAKKTQAKPVSVSKNEASFVARRSIPELGSRKKQLPLVTDTHRFKNGDTTVNLTPPPVPKGTCIVQKGDTFAKIQRRTGTPVSEILRLNKLTAGSPLRPGKSLRIAPPDEKRATAGHAVRTTPSAARTEEKPAMAKSQPEPARDSRSNDRLAAYDLGAQPAPTSTASHKVGAGETYSSIRRAYGVTQAQLTKANPGVDPNRLRPGQTLMIPGQPMIAQAKAPVVRADGRILAQRHDPLMAAGGVEETPAAARTRTGYLVADGDNIQKIANRFNTTDREIRRLNRMGDTDDIYPGRYIFVPFVRQATDAGAYARHDT